MLFTPSAVTDAQLAAGRDWYLTEAKKYDISTEKARTELKRFARPLQKLRTGIEARAKELTGATKRKIAAIDSEKRRLVQLVGGIEDEVLQPLTAWEQEEETRKAKLAGIVARLAGFAQTYHPDIPTLTAAIAELESFDLSTMQEYKVGAESAIAASLRVLKPELERRKVAEANEAELARLRAEAAERAEQDRLAEQKRQEDARVAAAAEALAAKKVEAVIAEVKQTTRQEVVAELAAANHNDSESDSNQGHGEPVNVPDESFSSDFGPMGDEGEASWRILKEQKIAELGSSSPEEYKTAWFEAQQALIKHLGLDTEDADNILQLIADGLIPHVTLTY